RLAKTAKTGLLCAFFLVTFQDLIPYFDNYTPKRSFIYALYWHFNGLFFIFLALGMISVIIAYYPQIPNRFKWYLKIFIVICLVFIPLEFLSNYFGAYWEKPHLVPRYFFTTSFFYLIWSLVNIQFLVKQFLLQENHSSSIRIETTDLALESYQLSTREKEIILLVVKGFSNQEIAVALHITVATVKTHLHRIYAKTGVKSRMELLSKLF
ncbi:MAG TPA: response regulator transcription factor, partial [Bacillota bacterium]|nr:response regulator transcription factor [Bacillota bacterium]